jgi:hypothetical protein
MMCIHECICTYQRGVLCLNSGMDTFIWCNLLLPAGYGKDHAGLALTRTLSEPTHSRRQHSLVGEVVYVPFKTRYADNHANR